MILLIIVVVVLADFALENRLLTSNLKLFTFTLGQLPTVVLVYAGLVLGLLVGWLGHVFRLRKKRRQAAAAVAQEQQAQEAQQSQ
jgi:uncharacterized integral membrane protein